MKVYCDTHVHCYDLEWFPRLLESAYQNFSARNSSTDEARYVLFFTDGKENTWPQIKALSDHAEIGNWRIEGYSDGRMLRAFDEQSADGPREILLAPARQINSAERLEFLLLGCEEDLPDGLGESDIIDNYGDDYLLICPWGFGKWLGKRGQLLKALLAKYKAKLFLGDNGGRPWAWFRVSLFRFTDNPVFNGSDPLPLESEIHRVANYALEYSSNDTREFSLMTLLEQLRSTAVVKNNYGNLLPLKAFMLGQLRSRKNKQ